MATKPKTKTKIKKGDQVQVLAGREKGKRGQVIRVMPKEGRVLVQGVNMVKRHQKPTAADPGGIKELEASLNVSNVALIDPKTDKPTKVGYKLLSDNRKVRFARASGEVIE